LRNEHDKFVATKNPWIDRGSSQPRDTEAWGLKKAHMCLEICKLDYLKNFFCNPHKIVCHLKGEHKLAHM
jgi:hypothetical protein